MGPRLKPLLVAAACLVTLCVIANCGGNRAGVQSSHDHSIDFSRYETYALHPTVQEAAEASIPVSRLARATEARMEKVGFTKADAAEADLLVIVQGGRKDSSYLVKEAQREYGSAKQAADMYQYTSGVLIVDMVDRVSDQVVYRAVGQSVSAVLGEEIVADDMTQEMAETAIKDVMGSFPPK